MVDLYVVLKPDREKALIDALYEVSDPGNLLSSSLIRLCLYSHVPLLRFRYDAHLSKEQVADLDTLYLGRPLLARVPSSSISASRAG